MSRWCSTIQRRRRRKMAPIGRRPRREVGPRPGPQAGTDRRWRLAGLAGLARVYRAIFRASIAVMLQYRIALLIWMLAHIMGPLIYLVVWSTVAGGGRVAGYAAADFAAYYLVLFRRESRNVHLDHLRVRIRDSARAPLGQAPQAAQPHAHVSGR